jgi:hypothetical protein
MSLIGFRCPKTGREVATGIDTDRAFLVYCTSPWCNHKLKPDWLPDHTALPALYSRMVCTACGLIGADVRPDLTPHTGSAGMGSAHSGTVADKGDDLLGKD